MDSSDCDELCDGILARMQSQKLLDQTQESDTQPSPEDGERNAQTKKYRFRAKDAENKKCEDGDNDYDDREEIDNENITDDDDNDDDDDDAENDGEDEQNAEDIKFTDTVKNLTLSTYDVS